MLPRSAVREMAQNQMADFWQKNEVILREKNSEFFNFFFRAGFSAQA